MAKAEYRYKKPRKRIKMSKIIKMITRRIEKQNNETLDMMKLTYE